MKNKVGLGYIFKRSEDVAARDVYDEFIIIPITSGIGKTDDELFSLNSFGKAVWDKMDGKRNLKEVAAALASEFEGPIKKIENDVLGFSEELFKRKLIIKV